MKIKSVTAAFFSPTGNAKKIVTRIAQEIAAREGLTVQKIDFTPPAIRNEDGSRGANPVYTFLPGDLVIFGTPVYAGRIPNKILPAFQTLFEGNGALAVPVVTFGNRSYDNALIEMCMELEKHGFHTVAGAAFVSEHVFSNRLAPGRPDESDMEEIRQFAAHVADKIGAIAPAAEGEGQDGMAQVPVPVKVKGEDPIPGYYRPLGADGKPAVFLKAKPKTRENCDNCGFCALVCPMGSISREDCRTVTGICIKCQACVKICPLHAKYFDDPAFLSHVQNLEDNYTRRAGNEVFL